MTMIGGMAPEEVAIRTIAAPLIRPRYLDLFVGWLTLQSTRMSDVEAECVDVRRWARKFVEQWPEMGTDAPFVVGA